MILKLDQSWLCISDLCLVLYLHIKFQLAGWYENPIKSVVLTFPLNKIVFPTVTLCPRDSRPDRWGSAIKIFDHLNTDCGSKRWDSMIYLKANNLILISLQRTKRERKKPLQIYTYSPTYPHFGSLKKLSYTKFMLVGLY